MTARPDSEPPIHRALELGLAAVLARGRPCGAALLADHAHLVTCAHVVNTALGRRPQEPSRPEAPVTVTFPYTDEAERHATVVAWRPVGEPDGDVAVLRALDGIPDGARPVDAVVARSVEGHRFQAWGFPQGAAGQMLAEGRLSRRRGDGRVQLDAHSGTGQPVREGFSGAPVWDCDLHRVVGMAQSRDPDSATRTAFLLPIDVIQRVWPQFPTREWSDEDRRRVAGERVSAAVENWRDRDDARGELRQLLFTGPRIITVTGRRGIGKSAMVAKVLADFEHPDPSRTPLQDLDALAYLSTRTGSGTLTLARIYDTVASLAPAEQQHRLARRWDNAGRDALPALWEALRDRRLVVVLDNLDDLQDPDTGALCDDDVTAFLASACRTPYGQRVVTTSLKPPRLPPEFLPHAAAVELAEGLPVQHAIEVLRALDRGGPGRLDDAQLAAAVARVHGVPRGLELLAQLIDDDPFAADELTDTDVMPEAVLTELVSRGYTRLDGTGRDVVGLLALAGVPLPFTALPLLLDGLVPEADVRAAVRRLVRDRELGYDRESGLLRLHPLDADFLRESLGSHERSHQVVLSRRLADWYATQRTPPAEWRRLDDAAPNKWEFTHRWRSGDQEGALAALADSAEFLARRGEAQVLRAAVHTPADPTNPGAVAYQQFCRAVAEFFDGSLDVAEQALRAAQAVAPETLPLSAEVDYWLGSVLRHRGDATAAAEVHRRLAYSDDPSVSPVRMDSLFQLGLSLCYLHDLAAAREVLGELEARVGPDGSPRERAVVADLRALAGLLAGDRETVVAAAAEGAAAYAATSRPEDAAFLFNVRAVAHLGADDLAAAGADLAEALSSAQNFAADRLVGMVASNLAWLRLREGRLEDARDAAELGARRLAANAVLQAPSPVALAALLPRVATLARDEVRRELDAAVLAAAGNADLYQPGDAVLDQIATALTAPAHR